MNTEGTNIGKIFWFRWVVANVIGWAVGEAMASFVPENTILIGGLRMAIIGVVGGIAQWLVLRRLERALWWVLATILVMAVSGAVGLAASFASGADVITPWAVLIMGLALGIGISQWLILRQKVSRAGWWVLVNTLGLPVGFTVGLIIAFTLGFAWENVGAAFRIVSLAFFRAVAGAVFGIISGAVLVWLLRQSPSSNIKGLATAH